MRSAHQAKTLLHALTLAAVILAGSTALPLASSASAQGMAGPSTGGQSSSEVAMEQVGRAATAVEAWARRSYVRRPAVMIGLAGALVLPVLAIAGLLLYRRRPAPGGGSVVEQESLPPATDAWIEIVGAGRFVMPQSRDILQIGRQDDNDICLDDDSVDRYHAVIERSRRAGFVIVDISEPSGDGMRVNGERCAASTLYDGDTVEVGRARLRFAVAA